MAQNNEQPKKPAQQPQSQNQPTKTATPAQGKPAANTPPSQAKPAAAPAGQQPR